MDPLKKVRPGERLQIPARAWNRVLDAISPNLAMTTGVNAYGQVTYLHAQMTRARYDAVTGNFPDPTRGYKIGDAINVPGWYGYGLPTKALPSDLTTGGSGGSAFAQVAEEEKLPSLSLDVRPVTLDGGDGSIGVIADMSVGDEDVNFKVIVSGVFTCRVLAFGLASRVGGGMPIPPVTLPSLRPLWRPYLMLSGAGDGKLLALGARYRLDSPNDWPRVYEALVQL